MDSGVSQSSYRIADGTDKLIDSTMRLWRQRMRRDISRDDAKQIIEHVTGFFDVLEEWEQGVPGGKRPPHGELDQTDLTGSPIIPCVEGRRSKSRRR